MEGTQKTAMLVFFIFMGFILFNVKAKGTGSFTLFSSYRTGKDEISATGIINLKLNPKLETKKCFWFGNNGEIISGSLTFGFEKELNSIEWKNSSFPYEVISLICKLNKSRDTKGGGYVVTTVDNQELRIFSEDANIISESSPDPNHFKYELSFCGSTFYGEVNPSLVRDFIEYYRVRFNVGFFNFYTWGGFRGNHKTIKEKDIKRYVKEKMASLTIIRDIGVHQIRHHGQVLAIADCTYRSRLESKWVLYGDIDEYFDPVPPNTLESLLSKYSNQAWLSHQAFQYNMSTCEPGTNDNFIIGRMIVREKFPYGRAPKLIGPGHRKLFVNPRKVSFPSIHGVLHGPKGVDLDPIHEARHNHYHGLGSHKFDKRVCKFKTRIDRKTEELDTRMRDIVNLIRKCPLGSPKDCFKAQLELAQGQTNRTTETVQRRP